MPEDWSARPAGIDREVQLDWAASLPAQLSRPAGDWVPQHGIKRQHRKPGCAMPHVDRFRHETGCVNQSAQLRRESALVGDLRCFDCIELIRGSLARMLHESAR
jgi:hypothetical protein